MWAPDIPFETFDGDPERRRTAWLVSNCPLKLVNYETLTRDADLATDPRVHFDVVVLDEAQRIKNKDSKTAQVVAVAQPRAKLGADRHADREPPGRPRQHLRVRRPRPHPARHAAEAARRLHRRLHPAADEGRRAVRHAAEDRSATWKSNSRPRSGRRTRGPRTTASSTSTNSATRSPCSTSSNS